MDAKDRERRAVMANDAVAFAPGQTWVPTRPGSRARSRTIVWANCTPPCLKWDTGIDTIGWVLDPQKPGYPETGHDSWVLIGSFREWVRKHAAVCQGSYRA